MKYLLNHSVIGPAKAKPMIASVIFSGSKPDLSVFHPCESVANFSDSCSTPGDRVRLWVFPGSQNRGLPILKQGFLPAPAENNRALLNEILF